jgi:outer membrane protein assembly factor BamB
LTLSSVSMRRWRCAALAFALFGLLLVGCVPLPADPSWSSISAVNGGEQILFAFHDRVTLIDPTDGSPVELRDDGGEVRVDDSGNPLRWEVRLQANPATQFYSAPIFTDAQTLVIPTFSRRFYEVDFPAARILNPEGRLVEDDSNTNHIITDVLATDDMYYVPMSENNLKALSSEDYSLVWEFPTEFGVWAKPLLVGDTLYVSSLDHRLYALDAATGDLRWQIDLGGAVPSAPVLYEGNLYVGSFDSKVFQISPDGEILAEFPTSDWVWGSPVIVDGVLYVGDSAGWVYALSITDGGFEQVWSRQVATRTIRATPLVVDDTLIVASRDSRVYWVDRTNGAEQFNRQMGGEVLANMLLIEPSETVNIGEPLVLVSTIVNQEALVAFTLEGGERRWVYTR